jgi:hypothetical protein
VPIAVVYQSLAFFANVAAIDRERRRSELETLREVVELDRSVVIRWMHLVFHPSEKGVLAHIIGGLRIARVAIHDFRDALYVLGTHAAEHSFDVCLILAARCVDFHEHEIGQGDHAQSGLVVALCHHDVIHSFLRAGNQIDPDAFLLPCSVEEPRRNAAGDATGNRPEKLASIHLDLRSGESHQSFLVAAASPAATPAESSLDEESLVIVRGGKVHAG